MLKMLIFLIIISAFLGFFSFKVYNSLTTENKIQKDNIRGTQKNSSLPPVSIVAENLDTPWSIEFLPDKTALFTERAGNLKRLNANGRVTQVGKIKNVKEVGEGGLLGVTKDPNFKDNNFIYLYYTYQINQKYTLNRVVRFKYQNNILSSEKIIVNSIPGNVNHNGGRIKFGPDGFLYITTGDAQEPSEAQNKKSLAGKILRVDRNGKNAPDNPFDNYVYSYGHRNPQGIAWDSKGQLWSTEHGRSFPISGLDEINKIDAGKNYGWPTTQGNEKLDNMEAPIINSNNYTWAPGGAAILNDVLYFGGLKGKSLYSVRLLNPTEVNSHFKNQFGRIRDVVVGPDKMLYITTSNKDGRGVPLKNDDKIIRVNPSKL